MIEDNIPEQNQENAILYYVLDKFNWGAFFLNWIWALVYKKYIFAVIIFIFKLIPLLGIIVVLPLSIWMGTQGNKWAWNAKKYKNIEEFNQIQKRWACVGICIFLLEVLGIFFALTIPSLMDENIKTRIAVRKAVRVIVKNTAFVQQEITDFSAEEFARHYSNAMGDTCRNEGNKIICSNGVEYSFESDGVCSNYKDCSILVDINGPNEPNEMWVERLQEKDRVKLYIKMTDGRISLLMPSVLYHKK